tara:strand:- start:101 stop:340 length:240 start_codon:yes stop_codon:yes gene_type:complete
MNINLNQKLLLLCDAYHAGKLTKDEYRIQRCIELESLNEQAEELSRDLPSDSARWKKKHIMVSVVLLAILAVIVVVSSV